MKVKQMQYLLGKKKNNEANTGNTLFLENYRVKLYSSDPEAAS